MPELKAVIFDMDGVLIDSQLVYDEIVDVILQRFGHGNAPFELKQTLHGISTNDTWTILRERYSLPASVAKLTEIELELFEARSARGEIPAMPFAFEAMKSLRQSGVKIAVATGNYRQKALETLRQNSAEALVDAVTSVDDVALAKPAPDLFLLAARRLGVEPEHCLVIEDAPAGVKAARAAGMRVILFARPERARSNNCDADAVLASFEGVTLATIKTMI